MKQLDSGRGPELKVCLLEYAHVENVSCSIWFDKYLPLSGGAAVMTAGKFPLRDEENSREF